MTASASFGMNCLQMVIAPGSSMPDLLAEASSLLGAADAVFKAMAALHDVHDEHEAGLYLLAQARVALAAAQDLSFAPGLTQKG